MGPKYLIGLTTNVEDGAPDRPAHYSLLSIITQITRRTASRAEITVTVSFFA